MTSNIAQRVLRKMAEAGEVETGGWTGREHPMNPVGVGVAAGVPVAGLATLGAMGLGRGLYKKVEKGKYGPLLDRAAPDLKIDLADPGAVHKLRDLISTPPAQSDTQKLMDQLLIAGGRNPKDVTLIPDGPPAFGTKLFGKGKNDFITMSPRYSSPAFLAHEVGHATPSNRAARALRVARFIGDHPLAGLIPLGVLAAGTSLSDRDATEMNVAQKAALPLAVLQQGGVLGEELRATLRGRQLLKQIGKSAPHYWRQTLPALGTYGLSAVGAIAPVLGGTYMLKKFLDKRKNGDPDAIQK